MLFETFSADTSPCRVLSQPARQFQAGLVIDAHHAALQIVKPQAANSSQRFDWASLNPCDWLLLSALMQHTGQHTRARAIHKLACHYQPQCVLLAGMHALELSSNRQYFECDELLKELQLKDSEYDRAVVMSFRCFNYSVMGWDQTASELHEQVLNQGVDDPVVWYYLSRGCSNRRQWQASVDLGNKAVELAPRWMRARRAVSDSMLAIGDIQGAASVLNPEPSVPHVGLEYTQAALLEVSGHREAAIDRYQTLLERWPIPGAFVNAAAQKMVLLLRQHGQREKAREITREYKLEAFEGLLGETEDHRSQFISLPLIAQTRNHCVPTVAAMVASGQGVPACPSEFAKAMNTQDGTSLWQMVDHMKTLGFRAICVRPEVEIATALLQQGVPLIGETVGLFGAHVECLCGFDNHLGLFHVRDPMHWQCSYLKYDALTDYYEGTCSLWAFIAPDKIPTVTVNEEWMFVEGQAYIDLARASETAERQLAEAAYALIADDHPLRFRANSMAKFVAITAGHYERDLKRFINQLNDLGEDDRVDLSIAQSLVNFINHDNADEIEALLAKHREKFSRGFIDYVNARCLYEKGLWHDALEALQKLCHRSPSNESLWNQLSSVQQQLGLRAESERSLQIAQEVAPKSEHLRQQKQNGKEKQLTFHERLQELRSRIEEFQSSPQSRLSLASLMSEHDNGLEYEASLRECIRFFPRYAWPYTTLASWYLQQDRDDLAGKILRAGRDLIGEPEFPLWEFEIDKQAETEAEATGSDETQAQTTAHCEEDTASQETPADPTSIITDCESQFSKLWDVVVKDCDRPQHEWQEIPEHREMMQLDQRCEIHWWQSARWLYLRFYNLMVDDSPRFAEDAGLKARELKSMLPSSVPGLPELYVERFVDSIKLSWASHNCLVVLLEWLDQMAPQAHRFPLLMFNRAYLLENLDQLNAAEAVFRQIVQEHPAYIGAWYRLAQIHEQRGDTSKACEYYGHCVSISPGHYGSLRALARIAIEEEHPDALLRRLQLCQTWPYDHDYLLNAARDMRNARSLEEAEKFVQMRRPHINPQRFHIIHARFLVDAGCPKESLLALQEHLRQTGDESSRDYGVHWLRADCAVQMEDLGSAATYLKKMHELWPNDNSVIDQLTRVLRDRDWEEGRTLAESLLTKGHSLPVLTYTFLQGQMHPSEVAIRLVAKMDLETSQILPVAEQLGRTIYDLFASHLTVAYLRFCNEHFPQLTSLRELLVHELSRLDEHEVATKIAESLLREEPGNARWLELLGRTWQVQGSPARGLPYLEQAWEVTGKPDTLICIGRTHQNLGNDHESRDAYLSVLEVEPHNTIALTNLATYHEDHSVPVWQLFQQTLQECPPDQLHSQYFLVAAYDLAQAHHQPLPIEWLAGAVARCDALQEQQGFHDELPRLTELVTVWLNTWSGIGQADWVPTLPEDFDVEQQTGHSTTKIRQRIEQLTNGNAARQSAQTNGTVAEIISTVPTSISDSIVCGSTCMNLGDYQNAATHFETAIRNSDERCDRRSRIFMANRLIDAENGGNLFDRLKRKMPFRLSREASTNIIIFGSVASGLLMALPFSWIKRTWDIPVGLSLAALALPAMVITFLTWLWHDLRGRRRLKSMMQQPIVGVSDDSDVRTVSATLQELNELSAQVSVVDTIDANQQPTSLVSTELTTNNP